MTDAALCKFSKRKRKSLLKPAHRRLYCQWINGTALFTLRPSHRNINSSTNSTSALFSLLGIAFNSWTVNVCQRESKNVTLHRYIKLGRVSVLAATTPIGVLNDILCLGRRESKRRIHTYRAVPMLLPCHSPAVLTADSHIPFSCRSPGTTLPFFDSAVSVKVPYLVHEVLLLSPSRTYLLLNCYHNLCAVNYTSTHVLALK
jgi:hypothetical protein